MKIDLQIALSRLASKEIQERFCVNATQSEYLLPEELLDSAMNWASTATRSQEFSTKEKKVVEAFLSIADQVADRIPFEMGNIRVDDLILRDPEWDLARRAAGECLNSLGLEMRIEI